MATIEAMREEIEVDRRAGVDYYERVPFARYAALLACAEALEALVNSRFDYTDQQAARAALAQLEASP